MIGMPRTLNLLAAGLLALTLTASAMAQSKDAKPAEEKPAEHTSSEPRPDFSQFVVKTHYLTNVSQQNDANEIVIALRNVLDRYDRMYLATYQNAIVLDAPPDQQALAQKIISDLDHPRKAYRLTFTLADSDNGKRIGVQHFAIVVLAGQRTVLKQGSKIPVITASINPSGESAQNQYQYQYLDIGMNFDATLESTPGGLYLKSKVEQSSLSDEHMSGALASEPIVRQTSLEGTSAVTLGKPITLGSVDIVGTTRHVDIEVVAEPAS